MRWTPNGEERRCERRCMQADKRVEEADGRPARGYGGGLVGIFLIAQGPASAHDH